MEVIIIHTRDNGTTIRTTLIDVDMMESIVSYEKGMYSLRVTCDFGPIGRQVDEEQSEWGGTGNYDESGWSFCSGQNIHFSSNTPIKIKVERN